MNAQGERKGIAEQREQLLRRNLAQAVEKPRAPVLSKVEGLAHGVFIVWY